MKFSNSIKVKCEPGDSTKVALIGAAEGELRRIADSCVENDGIIAVDGINNSFGSILRNDKTIVRVKPSHKGDGYLLEAETEFKPSVWFWIFFAIDIILIETVIGFVVGMGITLGLYFYNKNLVQDGLKQALQNAAETVS